ERMNVLIGEVFHAYHSISRKIDQVSIKVQSLFMLPFSSISEGFLKMIRDLAIKQKKKVKLIITGSDVIMDKRLLDKLKDPLIHILRNAVDHGIENPENRRKIRKNENGIISIQVEQLPNNSISISISDDGEGIKIISLKKELVDKNIIKESEIDLIDEEKLIHYIFSSEISTSSKITDISGRGLGLAIVKETMEELGGVMKVVTHAGSGTTFSFIIPNQISSYRGIVVRLGDELFIIPLRYCIKAIRITLHDIKTIESMATIQFQECPIPLFFLHSILEVPIPQDNIQSGTKFHVIILNHMYDTKAFIVDEVVTEKEVVIKPFHSLIKKVKNLSGVALMSDGIFIPVLDPGNIIRSVNTFKSRNTTLQSILSNSTKKIIRQKILIAEDSITTRTLLRNILEASGYDVTIAVDGQEALEKLENSRFNLVISDIDMPHMNGIVFTSRIREKFNSQTLPIILATGMENEEDKIKGIAAGANAYLIKSNFNQTGLLNTVRRLI
ncbi:MAG: response regulator, partial [Candidatus Pacearchaeota archaeon]|nr:response regulator [Candidatus Pacearchaeota archaeon]